MKRFTPLDYFRLELGSQWRRLAYAWAVSQGRDYCHFPPRKIAIEASSFCNLRCIHCAHGTPPDGVGERMTRTKSHMSMDLYRKIVDEAAGFHNSTKLVFALMGEPLMNKNMVDMIAYAHGKGLWTQVNTNAVLLDRRRAEGLIDAGLDFIYLSLDGITKETYEKIRVRGDFDRVLGNILDFIELKYVKKAFDLTIHIGMTAEIINRSEIDLFVKEFSKLPLDAVYSPQLFNWLSAIEWANPDEGEASRLCHMDFPVCNSSYDICGIHSNGGFVPCIYDFDGRYVSGNVNNQSILELWNNHRTRLFRKAINDRDYSLIEENGPMCSQCTILHNPQYQVIPGLAANLKQIAQYTGKAFRDWRGASTRRAQAYDKFLWFREHRREFVAGLGQNNAAAPKEETYFNVVQQDGVLRIHL